MRVVSRDTTKQFHCNDSRRDIAEIIGSHGLALNTRCAKRGLCRGCAVILEEGSLQSGQEPIRVLKGEPAREVLSCQCQPDGEDEIVIRIPDKSLLLHPPSIVSDFRTGVPAGSDPIFQSWRDFPLGLAVDIGTTTVAVLLASLADGRILARASALNSQIASGDNVLTRIQLCQDDKTQIRRLHDAFWNETFQPLLAEVLRSSGSRKEDLAGVVLAGNTTMLHLAAGEDPTPLGTVPFRPAFLESRRLDSTCAGLGAQHEVILLPGISAYVGADIAAGAVCSGTIYGGSPQLLVDVGTNGEMILSSPQGKLACATAAGPAFEGCGLTCGMRAAAGVVGSIAFETDPFIARVETIGGKSLVPGIAGSAYVDFLAGGRRIGLLRNNGRFDKEFVAKNPAHFLHNGEDLAFLPVPGHAELRITEVDTALLLQAKAAIAAGVCTLLERQGLTAAEIGRVDLAGGFGLNLSIPNAIACGLLPEFLPAQVEAVGNSSLGGAYLAMIDRNLAREMEDLRGQVETIELNLDPGFEDRYIDALSLPEP